jgi:membrane dipeptidase
MVAAPIPDEHLERARELIGRTVVWDNHGCMPVARPSDTSFLPQLQRYRDAGMDAVTLNIGFGDHGIEDHFRALASMRRWLLDRPEHYLLIQAASDVARARESGRLAVAFDIEGANAIGDQISLLEAYEALGVRWMLLACNRNNRVGGGCQDEDMGLTSFGREVVREMERLDMLVCLSHTGHRTACDALAMAQKPVIFSHGNPGAVRPHPRNIPDPPELGYRTPFAMVAPEQLPEIVAVLQGWGYSEEDLAGILGGNLVRLMH